MKKAVVTFVILSVVAFSCNHFYREYDKVSFEGYNWKYGQGITFTPTITDNAKRYSMTLGVRHIYGLQLNTLMVVVKTVTPSGKSSSKNYNLNLRDSGGNYIGDCAGDMCDMETIIEENLSFEEAGKYTFVITHHVQAKSIPGIMELGVILDEKN